MRQITLTHRLDHSTTLLQWNEVTDELFGNAELIAEINAYIGFAIDQGYWPLLPTYNYPITNMLIHISEMNMTTSLVNWCSKCISSLMTQLYSKSLKMH